MRPTSGITAGLLLITATGGALAVSEPQDVSIYDRAPQCSERDSPKGQNNCVLDDGPPPRPYIRRNRAPAVNAPQNPATGSGPPVTTLPPASNQSTERR